MNIKPKSNQLSRLFLTLAFLLFLSCIGIQAGETLVTVASQSGTSYHKPEVRFAPNGDIYVVYQAQNSSGRSDIYLSKYAAGRTTLIGNVSESAQFSYEPEIDIQTNGTVHIVWCDQNGSNHTIKYRSYNGSSFSSIQSFGQVGNSDNIEDLRLAVDPSGNIFAVFMYWPIAKCKFISKYGGTVSFEDFPLSGRSKHPDVAADANNVHIVWQFKPGGDYTIAYQRRPNSLDSNWENWIDLEFYDTQRPRMDLDTSNNPHIVFFHDLGSTRKLYYKRWNGSRFVDQKVVSDPNSFESYHFCDINVVNSENMIVTMQKGGFSGGQQINYNWMRNGTWGGFSFFGKSYGNRPAQQSTDLSSGKFLAATAFASSDSAVYLILAEEEGNPGGGGDAPTANFVFSPQTGKAPLTITFDAAASTDTDGHITSYAWNFGDGLFGNGSVTTHTFQNEGEYLITLTVTDNDGHSGTISHTVIVEKPNLPPSAHFTFSPLSGLYPLTVTFDASASSDPDGFIAQYDWSFSGDQSGSGQVVSHTFTEEGLNQIILTVYDNDGASSSASGLVEVLGLVPPINIAYEVIINRNIFTIQQVYKVTWSRNPVNAERGSNVVHYNIYRKRPDETAYTYTATVAAADVNIYYDRFGTEPVDYQYTITAIDDQGRESNLPSQASQRTTKSGPHRRIIQH